MDPYIWQAPFHPSGAMWSAAFGDPSHRVHKWMPGADTLLVAVTERPPLPVFWLSPVVRGDFYWTVVFDKLDVPYVVRARITPLW